MAMSAPYNEFNLSATEVGFTLFLKETNGAQDSSTLIDATTCRTWLLMLLCFRKVPMKLLLLYLGRQIWVHATTYTKLLA
jgi:hypothetical protein